MEIAKAVMEIAKAVMEEIAKAVMEEIEKAVIEIAKAVIKEIEKIVMEIAKAVMTRCSKTRSITHGSLGCLLSAKRLSWLGIGRKSSVTARHVRSLQASYQVSQVCLCARRAGTSVTGLVRRFTISGH